MEQAKKRISGIKIFWIVFGSILGLLFIWLILTVNSEIKAENKLIAMRDHILDTEQVEMSIISKGEYAKIEKVMKEYYQEYFKYYKQVNNNDYIAIYDNATLEFSNNDSEELTKLLNDLNNYQELFNQGINGMIRLLDEEEIEYLFIEANIDYYYLDFYKELMILDTDQETLTSWEDYKDENDKKMPFIKNMLEILVNNSDQWYIENGTLYIIDANLLEEYNNNFHLAFDNVENEKLPEGNFM